MNGLGISPAPSMSNPVLMQAGRRSAIDEYLNSKVYAYEFTAVMYQGDLESMNIIHNNSFSKNQLSNFNAEEEYIKLRNPDKLTMVTMKSKLQT
jgi:hypothetical protein